MQVTVNWATLDVQAPDDVQSGVTPIVQIGWAEFDTNAQPVQVSVAWASFDTGDPVVNDVPTTGGGGYLTSTTRYPAVTRYYNADTKKYEIPVFNISEEEEELVILQLLIEIAQDELL